MTIRRLTAEDLPLMSGLLTMFGVAFDEVDTYGAHRPDDAYLRGLLESDSFVALAAVEQGVVVGGLAAYELKKFEQPRSEMYIYDLAVAEAHRRKGIATGLIEALKGLAASRGVYVIFVQADPIDAPAVALYEKLGARENVLHFDISVG